MTYGDLHRLASSRLVRGRAWGRSTTGFLWGAVVGGVGSVAHALAGWPVFWPLLFAPLVALVAGGLALWSRGPSRDQVAHELDRRFGLKEAALTESWLEARGKPGEQDEGLAPLVSESLEEKLSAITPRALREAFPFPRRGAKVATALAVLALAALVSPRVPTLRAPDPAARRAKEQAAARRKEDAAARKLVAKVKKDASELEKLAARRKWEKLLAASKALKTRAAGLEKQFPGAARAKVRMEAWSKEASKAITDALDGPGGTGRGRGDAAEGEDVEEMTAIARALESLDLDDLAGDMEEAARALRESATARRGEADTDEHRSDLDARRLEDLKERLESAARRLEELRKLLDAHPELKELLGGLTREQLEKLKEITQELDRLLKGMEADPSGAPPTPEDLKKLADLMKSLSVEDLQRVLDALREMEALQALQDLAQAAASGAPLPSLESLLQGLGSGMGPGRGTGAPRPKSETAKTEEKTERLRGRVDPEGQVIRRQRFRGLPRKVSTKEELNRLAKLVEGAEEGVIRRRLSPSARPWVKRYFEALRAASQGGGKH